MISELIGPVLVLGALVWTVGAVITGRAGWASTGRARRGIRRYERRPHSWWGAIRWIPAGFALAKLADAPFATTVVLSVLVAVVHRAVPDALDIVLGGGGLAVALSELLVGSGCAPGRGAGQTVAVLLATAAVVAVSALAGRRRSRFGTAAVTGFSIAELSLFALAPPGLVTFDLPRAAVWALALLAIIAVLSGREPDFAHSALGAGLIIGDLILTLNRVPCAPAAGIDLAGACCFAAARYLLAERSVRRHLGLR
jgi:hypothetical protein